MVAPELRRIPLIGLRFANAGDAALLKRWREEPAVAEHQPLRPASVAQLRAELARQRAEDLYSDRGDKFQWVILADDRPVGWITLVIANWEHGLAEVGYAISTDFQRRGLMPVALEQLLYDLFFSTTLRRIEARCSIDNRASQKVLERVGFEREGLLKEYFILRGKSVDNYLYAVLRDRFVPRIVESHD